MNEEKMTPEQEETALYEKAIEVFGKDQRIETTVEALNKLSSALLCYHLYVKYDKPACGKQRCLLMDINFARAEVAIMLNQLDLMLGDNSENEIDVLTELRRQLVRKIGANE